MKDKSNARSAQLSRRSLLRNATFAAGGAAILGTTTAANRASAAETKVSQKLAAYQDTPKGPQRCDNCTQFQPPSSCKVVEGNISPAGWCALYVMKPAAG